MTSLILLTIFLGSSLDVCAMSKGKKLNYSKVKAEFKAAKEGMFSDKARYGLLLFGKKGKYPMWVVSDFVTTDAGKKRVMYMDADCDGIVGEAGEQLELTRDDQYSDVHLLKQWKNPVTNEVIDMTALISKDRPEFKGGDRVMFFLKLQGLECRATLTISHNIIDAGKLWIDYSQDFTFLTSPLRDGLNNKLFYYGEGKVDKAPEISKGKNERIYNIGIKGTKESTWFLCHSSMAEKEGIIASVTYKDKNGVKKTHKSILDHKC